jgi:plastocyanin
MMKRISVLALVLTISLAVVGCGGGDTSPQQTQAFSAQFDVVIEDETKKYDPMELTVTGDHGTIEVTNNLDAEHGFVIREFGIEAAIPAGETRTFNVDSAAPGEYMVDCHLHAAHAEATLVVEAP